MFLLVLLVSLTVFFFFLSTGPCWSYWTQRCYWWCWSSCKCYIIKCGLLKLSDAGRVLGSVIFFFLSSIVGCNWFPWTRWQSWTSWPSCRFQFKCTTCTHLFKCCILRHSNASHPLCRESLEPLVPPDPWAKMVQEELAVRLVLPVAPVRPALSVLQEFKEIRALLVLMVPL